VAFAPREALLGDFVSSTSREAFAIAHDVSSYSLTALTRAAAPLMAGRAGAVLTLSYLGAVKSVPAYNVMGLAKASLEANVRFLAADLGPKGIRVNGISAGPIKTLAAAGIPGLRKMLAHVAQTSPLRRNVTPQDVGNAATFLCSDMASGVTGEILYVDGGFSTVGMSFPAESAGTSPAWAAAGRASTAVSPDNRATMTVQAESASTLIDVRAMSSKRSSTSSTPMASGGSPTAVSITEMATSEAAGIPAMPMDVTRASSTTVTCVTTDRCRP
jgi:hypothetical protein